MKKINSFKKITVKKGAWAFTLAEVLITLMIIGIVTVITLPVLLQNVEDKVYEKSDSVFQRRLGEALKVMNLHGTLAGHETTDAFVSAFRKNLRISKVCSSAHLSDCFGRKFKVGEGTNAQNINVSGLTSAKKLNKDVNYGDTEVVGVRFDNGVTALIAYNLFADQNPYDNNFIKVTNSGSGTKDGNATVQTDALAILYDLDGADGPGVFGKDIKGVNINLNLMTGVCAGTIRTIDGKKYCDLGTNYSAYGTYGDANSNNWLGAQKACQAAGGSLLSINALGNLNGHDGAPTSGGYWSSSESSDIGAYGWDFGASYKYSNLKSYKYSALCSGDY